jgi:hypothetical protein
MKQQFEQFIRDTLERRSASELGFPYEKEKIWEAINSKRKKQKTFFLRPALTHAAAAIAGIILTAGVMFFVFRKKEAGHPVKAIAVAEQKSAMPLSVPVMRKGKEHLHNTTTVPVRKQASATALALSKTIPVKKTIPIATVEKTIATKKETILIPVIEKETRLPQTTKKEKPVMYWADIAPDYVRPEEPKAWTKINARIRRINDKKQENPDALPGYVAFLKAFK